MNTVGDNKDFASVQEAEEAFVNSNLSVKRYLLTMRATKDRSIEQLETDKHVVERQAKNSFADSMSKLNAIVEEQSKKFGDVNSDKKHLKLDDLDSALEEIRQKTLKLQENREHLETANKMSPEEFRQEKLNKEHKMLNESLDELKKATIFKLKETLRPLFNASAECKFLELDFDKADQILIRDEIVNTQVDKVMAGILNIKEMNNEIVKTHKRNQKSRNKDLNF